MAEQRVHGDLPAIVIDQIAGDDADVPNDPA